MEFYEILTQVIALPQREGRVSYRALKRQFNLDDDFLEDMKAEVAASASLQESRDRTDGGDLSLGWMGTDGYQGAAQIHKRRAVAP
jgi:hypothetical protein